MIAFLMWKHNQPYDKAYQAVKAIRGVTNPNIGFTCQVPAPAPDRPSYDLTRPPAEPCVGLQLLNWAKRRNGARSPSRAYQIAPHSEDTKYPVYLVARLLPDVAPSILDPAKALLLRLPQTSYIWQVRLLSHLADPPLRSRPTLTPTSLANWPEPLFTKGV